MSFWSREIYLQVQRAVVEPEAGTNCRHHSDGKLDLIVTPDDGSMTVQTFLGRRWKPSCQAPPSIGKISADIELADFNGDPQVLTSLFTPADVSQTSCDLTPLHQRRAGHFTPRRPLDLQLDHDGDIGSLRTIAIGALMLT